MSEMFYRVPPDAPAILQDTDPILRSLSKPVETFGQELSDLAARMAYAMTARNGLGLSAVQIGEPLCLIVVRDEGRLLCMANPVITRRLNRNDIRREGCLSVAPMNWKPIARPAKCEVEWQDLAGVKHSGGFSGMTARAIQHEVDHLAGILITDLPRA